MGESKEWHLKQKVMVGVIVAVSVSFLSSMYQFMWIVSSLDTTPPIVERVIALEFAMSQQGKTNEEILSTLKDIKITLGEIGREQSRRKPMVDYIERKMGK